MEQGKSDIRLSVLYMSSAHAQETRRYTLSEIQYVCTHAWNTYMHSLCMLEQLSCRHWDRLLWSRSCTCPFGSQTWPGPKTLCWWRHLLPHHTQSGSIRTLHPYTHWNSYITLIHGVTAKCCCQHSLECLLQCSDCQWTKNYSEHFWYDSTYMSSSLTYYWC